MTRSIVSFGDTTYSFYIGNAVANALPYIVSTFLGDDFEPSLEMRVLASMKTNINAGVVYFSAGEEKGFNTIEYGANGTFLKSTGNGLVWDTPSAGGSISITFED